LSEIFHQVQALRRWSGRHHHSQTHICFLDHSKITAFSCGL